MLNPRDRLLLALLWLTTLSGCAVEGGVYDRGRGPTYDPPQNVDIARPPAAPR
jgi:hypothetical protein